MIIRMEPQIEKTPSQNENGASLTYLTFTREDFLRFLELLKEVAPDVAWHLLGVSKRKDKDGKIISSEMAFELMKLIEKIKEM